MSKYLIVDADDFGHTMGVSEGILNAYRRGIATSTTALMNKPGVAASLLKARKICPGLGLGVHLVLTAGHPILTPIEVPSLTGGKDQFDGLHEFITNLGGLDLSEVCAEWMAQINLFIKTIGQKPDHLDSHHSCSYLSPSLFEIMLKLANEFGIPIRMPFCAESDNVIGDLPKKEKNRILRFYPQILERFIQPFPQHFIASFYDEGVSFLSLKKILEQLPTGTSKLMCHPGYVDDELYSNSTYNNMRERELEILTNDGIKTCLSEYGIELINFSQLY